MSEFPDINSRAVRDFVFENFQFLRKILILIFGKNILETSRSFRIHGNLQRFAKFPNTWELCRSVQLCRFLLHHRGHVCTGVVLCMEILTCISLGSCMFNVKILLKKWLTPVEEERLEEYHPKYPGFLLCLKQYLDDQTDACSQLLALHLTFKCRSTYYTAVRLVVKRVTHESCSLMFRLLKKNMVSPMTKTP